MDYHKEIRHSYLGGFSILLVEGISWLLAGMLGYFVSFQIGIITIIIAGMLFYPMAQIIQILLRRPKIDTDNPLNSLFTQIALIIPFSFSLIFLIARENVNLFFPALTIIVGLHYLPFVYAYKMRTYWLLAVLLIVGGSYFGFFMPDNFGFCSYYTGFTLLLFANINRKLVLKEIGINSH